MLGFLYLACFWEFWVVLCGYKQKTSFMIFKHQYFQLDTDARKVFDENGRELYFTGNSYKLLCFLCEKGSANISDINVFFDPAASREYKEDHIRQYRYRIRTALGQDIIEYKNYVYSIEGRVEKIEKIQEEIKKEIAEEKTEKPAAKPVYRNNRRKVIVIAGALLLAMVIIVFAAQKKTPAITRNNSPKTELTKPQDDMIQIPAGEFLIGSTEQQALASFLICKNDCLRDDYLAEYPQHTVFLKDYYIDKKGVSNADYKLFVQATGYEVPPYWNDSNLNSPNQPVVGTSWNDAKSYCEWLGKRLPTEAEREKAARGTDGRIWPWGNTWDNMKDNHGKGGNPSYDESDGYKYAAPVGTELGVSPYGVMNLPRAYARGFGLFKQQSCLPQILFSLILNVFSDDCFVNAYG
ncbi:MAG: formylglycine-generating enzyme family protein [Candidatus Moranbacteria bacterium]|nr:formylglycine-generating enzyme family protein [Candidatus Moranbacteria bacterium]